MTLPSIFIGSDGSKTLLRDDLNETYHSRHGAIPESNHVFIGAGLHFGLNQWSTAEIQLLEIGFGTGLNAMLTALEAERLKLSVHYHALETVPLPYALVQDLGYFNEHPQEVQGMYQNLHEVTWEEEVKINNHFSLHKTQTALEHFVAPQAYHLIYFDAFAPDIQPELWQTSIFQMLYDCMHPQGILVTYSSKGDVRRSLMTAGFEVSKLEGPPRKRHMLRAIKK
jgi:tRNA U34 5-methylaminomethyl-2-thiouridine-forming methyltransferase MnmC